MPQCAFCENSKLTREHIWSNWICQAIGPNGITRTIGMQDGSVKQIKEPVLSASTKVVCGACNNGWMSTLEAAAKPNP